MLIHWIWLATRPDLNDRLKVAVVECFGDPEDAFYAEPGSYSNVEGMTEEAVRSLCDKELHQAQKILEECADKDIHILTYRDAGFLTFFPDFLPGGLYHRPAEYRAHAGAYHLMTVRVSTAF